MECENAMNTYLLVAIFILLAASVVIQLVMLLRKARINMDQVDRSFDSVERSFERTERAVRDEISGNRQELLS